ncbi:hypothetical protein [Arthrobacter sp. C152]
MTELSPDDGLEAVQPSPDWPASPQDVADPLVQHALDRLETLPEIPVGEHEAVYNVLHDDLLAALNEDPAGSAAAGSDRTGGAA